MTLNVASPMSPWAERLCGYTIDTLEGGHVFSGRCAHDADKDDGMPDYARAAPVAGILVRRRNRPTVAVGGYVPVVIRRKGEIEIDCNNSQRRCNAVKFNRSKAGAM